MPSLAQITALSRQFDAALHQFKALDLGMSDEERYPSSCGISAYDPKKKTYPSIYLSGPKDEFADLPDSGEAVIRYQVTRRSTEEENGKKRHSLTIEVRSIDPKAAAKAVEKKKAEGRAVPVAMSNAEGRMTNFGAVDATMRELRLPIMKGTPKKMRRKIYEVNRDTAWAQTAVDPKQAAKWQKGILHARENQALSSHNRSGKKAREMLLPGKRKFAAVGSSYEFNRPRDGDGQFVANTTGGADPVTMRQAYGPDPKKSKLLAPGAAAAAVAGTAGLLGTKTGRGMVLKGTKGAARVVRSAVTGIQRKSQGRSTERYPVMGSKAPKGKPGFGETLMRQRMRGD